MAKNTALYIPIKKRSIRYSYFMYFDKEPYLADQLFIKYKIRVWFDEEIRRQNWPYLSVICHVRKDDVPEFMNALEELKTSMLICGYMDYEEEISNYIELIYAAGRVGEIK